MKRGVKIILIGFAVLLIAAVAASGWLFNKAIPIGTGFVAKYICSSTFISNRDPEIVFREDVEPEPLWDHLIHSPPPGIGLDSDFYTCRMVSGRESNFSPRVG